MRTWIPDKAFASTLEILLGLLMEVYNLHGLIMDIQVRLHICGLVHILVNHAAVVASVVMAGVCFG